MNPLKRATSGAGLKSFVISLVLVLLTARLFVFAFQISQDFEVYWRAVRYWLSGVSPYIVRPEDLGFVFKYPPWMIPVLAPVGWMSWDVAKLFWAAVELLLLIYSVRRLIQLGVSRAAVLWSLFFFWWIWLAHFTSGQITLVLMAGALWAYEPAEQATSDFRRPQGSRGTMLDFRAAVLTILFSAKIFSMVTLFGVLRRVLRIRTILFGLAFLIVSHLAVLGVYRLHGNPIGLLDLYQQWFAAAASGGAELGEDVVRGTGNHGLTAGVLRAFHVDARATKIDTAVFLGLSLFFGTLWVRVSSRFPSLDQWLGWVALGLIVHPLAWHHSFVLAFPFCALSLHRALETRDRRLIALSVFGMVCIGIFIPQVIGKTLVKPLELGSVKSWGVVFSALSLSLANRRGRLE